VSLVFYAALFSVEHMVWSGKKGFQKEQEEEPLEEQGQVT